MIIRQIKIKKTLITKGDYPGILKACGLVDGKRVDPSSCYMSDGDLKTMRKAITKQFKTEYPLISDNNLRLAVSLHCLNLEPNKTVASLIKDGYALVIKEEKL